MDLKNKLLSSMLPLDLHISRRIESPKVQPFFTLQKLEDTITPKIFDPSLNTINPPLSCYN